MRKAPIACSICIRRQAWSEVGGFDDHFSSVLDDWEFYMRLAQRFTFHHVNVTTSQYTQPPGNKAFERFFAFEAGIDRMRTTLSGTSGALSTESGLDEAMDRLRRDYTLGRLEFQIDELRRQAEHQPQDEPLTAPKVAVSLGEQGSRRSRPSARPPSWPSSPTLDPRLGVATAAGTRSIFRTTGMARTARRTCGTGLGRRFPAMCQPVTCFALASSCMPLGGQASTGGAPHSSRKERNGSSPTIAASGNPSSLCVSSHERPHRRLRRACSAGWDAGSGDQEALAGGSARPWRATDASPLAIRSAEGRWAEGDRSNAEAELAVVCCAEHL